MPEIAPLLPEDPARLGPYTLVGRLGRGGYGVVYLAEAANGDRVAVKLLQTQIAEAGGERDRFAREAAAAKQVARFCTAQVIDANVAGDRPYIVSEYVAGPSLQGLVTGQGPLEGGALDRLAVGTATALVAIHQAGVVHRDLKPPNVLIGPDGPRVIDFGIARMMDRTATVSGQTLGTPAYMAPEQVLGRDVTAAADVFAWGATVVFAANGAPPFGRDTIAVLAHRIVNEPAELGALSGRLRGLVAECMHKDPARRPSASALLMRLLGHDMVPGSAQAQTAILAEGLTAAVHPDAVRGMAAAVRQPARADVAHPGVWPVAGSEPVRTQAAADGPVRPGVAGYGPVATEVAGLEPVRTQAAADGPLPAQAAAPLPAQTAGYGAAQAAGYGAAQTQAAEYEAARMEAAGYEAYGTGGTVRLAEDGAGGRGAGRWRGWLVALVATAAALAAAGGAVAGVRALGHPATKVTPAAAGTHTTPSSEPAYGEAPLGRGRTPASSPSSPSYTPTHHGTPTVRPTFYVQSSGCDLGAAATTCTVTLRAGSVGFAWTATAGGRLSLSSYSGHLGPGEAVTVTITLHPDTPRVAGAGSVTFTGAGIVRTVSVSWHGTPTPEPSGS